MRWDAVGVWQAGSGVCMMLLCEEETHFWKETAHTFQAQLPYREISAPGVVAGVFKLFCLGHQPRNRPAW